MRIRREEVHSQSRQIGLINLKPEVTEAVENKQTSVSGRG